MRKCVCLLLFWAGIFGCSDDESTTAPDPRQGEWKVVVNTPQSALLAINGTAADDVWVVGADDGTGPMVLHYDGSQWKRKETGVRGDLWWVKAFKDGTVYMAGSDELVLRYRDGMVERLEPPGLSKVIIFGI